MRIKIKNKLFFALLITMGLMLFMCKVKSDAASNTNITQITIETGEKAINKLKEKGFKPCYQNINCMDNVDYKVCIGYKKGSGAPITNLIVSEQNASQITFNNIIYKQVSSVAINNASNHASVFLYFTTDGAAGDALKSISFNTYDPESLGKNKSDGFALLNDGSEPVRSAQNNASYNFANDDNTFTYVMMIKNNIYKPFVKDIHMVIGSSKRDCILALSGKGCNYYCEDEFATTNANAFMMIGFTKTKNEAESLKNILTINDPNSLANVPEITCNGINYKSCDGDVWKDYNKAIYITYDGNAGKAVRDIYTSDYDEENTTVKKYVKNFATKNKRSLAVSFVLQDKDYERDTNDKTKLEANVVPYFNGESIENGDIVLLTQAKVDGSPWNANVEEFKGYLAGIRTQTPIEEQKENEVEEKFEEVQETQEDEEPKEDEEKVEDNEENEGSIFGNTKVIIIVTIIVLAGAATIVYKKKGIGKHEDK